MKIIISKQHSEKFPQFSRYAEKKVQKLSKFNHKIVSITVHLISEESHRGQEQDYYCELQVQIPGNDLIIKDTERAMDKAIDKAVERARTILVKEKERKISEKHKAAVIRKEKIKF